MVYVGKDVSEGSAGASVGVGRGGLGRPAGGVIGEIVAGQVGRGLVCCIGGGVIDRLLMVLVFGKNLSCYAVSWQTCWRAGANMCVMRCVIKNRFMPSLLEMRTSSTGHLAGDSSALSLSVCLWDRTKRIWPVGI